MCIPHGLEWTVVELRLNLELCGGGGGDRILLRTSKTSRCSAHHPQPAACLDRRWLLWDLHLRITNNNIKELSLGHQINWDVQATECWGHTLWQSLTHLLIRRRDLWAPRISKEEWISFVFLFFFPAKDKFKLLYYIWDGGRWNRATIKCNCYYCSARETKHHRGQSVL